MIIIIWACSPISSNMCVFDLTILINGTTLLGASPNSFPPKHENINSIHIRRCMWSYWWAQASPIVSIWTLSNLCSTYISYRFGGLGAIRSLEVTQGNIKPPSLVKATLATKLFLLSSVGFLIPKNLHSFSYRDLMWCTFNRMVCYYTIYKN